MEDKAQRLDRLLSSRGYCSRRDVRAWLRDGVITVSGEPADDPSQRVLPAEVRVDGEPLDPASITLALHKPIGCTCSRSEEPSVYSFLPQRYQAREPSVESVGRLDKDTSGLLIFTDDGQLLHRITSPKHHVAKRYLATLADALRGDEVERFASGTLMLEGERDPCLPAQLQPLSGTTALITVYEGRYHQVRRMFAAVGNRVEALVRTSIGDLTVDGIAEGEYKMLGPQEISAIFASKDKN